jgi:hypothetical protein
MNTAHKKSRAIPVTGRGDLWKLWDIEDPTLSTQSAHRWRLGCQPCTPAAPYPLKSSGTCYTDGHNFHVFYSVKNGLSLLWLSTNKSLKTGGAWKSKELKNDANKIDCGAIHRQQWRENNYVWMWWGHTRSHLRAGEPNRADNDKAVFDRVRGGTIWRWIRIVLTRTALNTRQIVGIFLDQGLAKWCPRTVCSSALRVSEYSDNW